MFPLPGALLLPRGQMPLNIFEPRYLAMIDDALARRPPADRHDPAGRRRIQAATSKPDSVQGRLRRPHHPDRRKRRRPLSAAAHRRRALPRRGGADGRDRLSPVPRHLSRRSPTTSSPARARTRSTARRCCARSRDFLKANNLKADWEGIENAPNEALVNALAMMSPYGAAGEAGAAGSAGPQDARRNSGRGHRDRARQEQRRRRNAVAVAICGRG